MRVVFTGSRHIEPAIHGPMVVTMIQKVFPELGITVVHGGGRGLDQMVDAWARSVGLPVEVFAADWDRYGRRAGPLRNSAMAESKPQFCIAFPCPHSVGTWDCIRKCALAPCPIHIYPVPCGEKP